MSWLLDDINVALATGHFSPTLGVIIIVIVALLLFRLLLRLGR